MSAPKKDPIFAAIAAEGAAFRRYGIAVKAVADIQPETARAPVAHRLDYERGEPMESLVYAYSHQEIDAFYDRERESVRGISGGKLWAGWHLSHNMRRARVHAEFSEAEARATAANVASGYTYLDRRRGAALDRWLVAERKLFKTRPATLAGMRAAIALAARRAKQDHWCAVTVRLFLAAMGRT